MKNVQISYDLFVALVEYHLGYDDEYEDEIRQGLEQKLDAWCGTSCTPNIRLLPARKNGSKLGRHTWTGAAYSQIFAGNRDLLSY